jgi:hypothetical protein
MWFVQTVKRTRVIYRYSGKWCKVQVTTENCVNLRSIENVDHIAIRRLLFLSATHYSIELVMLIVFAVQWNPASQHDISVIRNNIRIPEYKFCVPRHRQRRARLDRRVQPHTLQARDRTPGQLNGRTVGPRKVSQTR